MKIGGTVFISRRAILHPMQLGSRNSLAPHLTVAALALLAYTTGCKKRAALPANGTQPIAVVSAPPSATVPSIPSAKPGTGSANETVRKQLDEAERAHLAAYVKALGRGRRATREGKYEQALVAFNEALGERPGDPRAFAERGYAALLAKNYDAAADDMEQAAATTSDKVLRAQIFYNLGLTREAQGRDAGPAFALSNLLHATPAATKKLEGKNTCPVQVDGTPEKANETRYPNWLTLLRSFKGNALSFDTGSLQTEAEAHENACGKDGCQGTGPWLVKLETTQRLYVTKDAEGLSVLTVASLPSWKSGFCYPDLNAQLVRRSGDRLVFRVDGTNVENVLMCDPEGDAHVCAGEDLGEYGRPRDASNFITTCRILPYTVYQVFNTVTRTWILQVTQNDVIGGLPESERPHLQVTETELRVTGPGCDLHLPFAGSTL